MSSVFDCVYMHNFVEPRRAAPLEPLRFISNASNSWEGEGEGGLGVTGNEKYPWLISAPSVHCCSQ